MGLEGTGEQGDIDKENGDQVGTEIEEKGIRRRMEQGSMERESMEQEVQERRNLFLGNRSTILDVDRKRSRNKAVW